MAVVKVEDTTDTRVSRQDHMGKGPLRHKTEHRLEQHPSLIRLLKEWK